MVGEVAKFLNWQQHQCNQEIVTRAKPQVGKAKQDRFCTKWNRFKKPSFALGSYAAVQLAREWKQWKHGFQSRAFVLLEEQIVLMHAWALWHKTRECQTCCALLCGLEKFWRLSSVLRVNLTLCAPNVSPSHSRRSHGPTLMLRHTQPPCFSLGECVMKDAMHQEAWEVKFWFRWIVQAGCYGLRLLIEASFAEKQLKVMEGIMEMWFIDWIWMRR